MAVSSKLYFVGDVGGESVDASRGLHDSAAGLACGSVRVSGDDVYDISAPVDGCMVSAISQSMMAMSGFGWWDEHGGASTWVTTAPPSGAPGPCDKPAWVDSALMLVIVCLMLRESAKRSPPFLREVSARPGLLVNLTFANRGFSLSQNF